MNREEFHKKIALGSVLQAMDKEQVLVDFDKRPIILANILSEYIDYALSQYRAGNIPYGNVAYKLKQLLKELADECGDVCIYREQIVYPTVQTKPTIDANSIRLRVSSDMTDIPFNDIVHNYRDQEGDLLDKIKITRLPEGVFTVNSDPHMLNMAFGTNAVFKAKFYGRDYAFTGFYRNGVKKILGIPLGKRNYLEGGATLVDMNAITGRFVEPNGHWEDIRYVMFDDNQTTSLELQVKDKGEPQMWSDKKTVNITWYTDATPVDCNGVLKNKTVTLQYGEHMNLSTLGVRPTDRVVIFSNSNDAKMPIRPRRQGWQGRITYPLIIPAGQLGNWEVATFPQDKLAMHTEFTYRVLPANNTLSYCDAISTVVVNRAMKVMTPPRVTLAGATKMQIRSNEPVTFEMRAIGSDNEGGVTYNWTKISGPTGERLMGTGSTVTMTASTPGTYVYKVRVTDEDGMTAEATASYVVSYVNTAPSVELQGEVKQQADEGATTTFNLTPVIRDAENNVVDVRYEYIGSPRQGVNVNIVKNGPHNAVLSTNGMGDFDVRVTVTDAFGATATTTATYSVSQYEIIRIDADYIKIDSSFPGGRDLDSRFAIIDPPIQNIFDGAGHNSDKGWRNTPLTGDEGLWFWNGDHIGNGSERAIIDLNVFKQYYPDERYLIVDFRGMWFLDNKDNDRNVNLKVEFIKGGDKVNMTRTPDGGWGLWDINGGTRTVKSTTRIVVPNDVPGGGNYRSDLAGYRIALIKIDLKNSTVQLIPGDGRTIPTVDEYFANRDNYIV